jgi:hypothetical protein
MARTAPAQLKRQTGFYWVRWTARDKWEPARWNGRCWMFIGREEGASSDPREVGATIWPPADKRG